MAETATATQAQPARSGVFRKQAMDSLGSPADHLDQMVRITSPRSWLTLVALVAVTAAVVLYGFLGTSRTTVSGEGIFLPPGGLVRLDATAAGTVTGVEATEGETVQEGTPLVTITTSEGQEVTVRSTTPGLVTEILTDRGNVVAPGVEVAAVEPPVENPTAIVFVGAGEGKAIEPGMTVHVSPATAPSAQYGQAIGRVVTISELPVTAKRLEFVLRNQILVEQIASLGSTLEMTVELVGDERTSSGLQWTSGDGPPFDIGNGTLTGASVIVDTQKPAAKLFDSGA